MRCDVETNSIGNQGETRDRNASRPRGRRASRRAPASWTAAVILTLAGVSGAWAQTYYVDGSSASCSNSGPGTEAQPYCTISAALAGRGGPGVTILVKPGIYREQVTVPASGISGAPLVIQAAGNPVVIDGADDFSSTSRWTTFSGDVWLASSVSWSPLQVFADGERLTPSTASPGSLPPRSFKYVSGAGLYVNAGGGNPGSHAALVGRRASGVLLSGRSWVTIDAIAVTRTEDKSIVLNSSTDVTLTRIVQSFANKYGMQAIGCARARIASCTVTDNNHHGIALTAGTTGCTIEDNESARNALPSQRAANGIYLYGAPSNLFRRNRWHDNQDTGQHFQTGSNNNVSYNNLSWNNGDHGFDHLEATGTQHVGDVAFGNFMDGFSVEGNATGTALHNCIAIENGLTTNEFDLWVDPASSVGLVSDDNLFWNSTSQPPIKYISTQYSTVAAYSAASGQDTRTIQVNPRFMDPAHGNFHLQASSPAIDNGNSSVANWPATDADGQPRADDPETPNTGLGPFAFADRGALEFQPTGSSNQPPVAALTVTPASGTAPLTVTADASGSSDPDGTIASYRFDFGDGTVVGPQPGATATHTYAAGNWTATVTVTDNAGATGSKSNPVTVTPPPGTNLVGNPSFETNTSGWVAYAGSALQRVSGGHDGSWSLRVTGPRNRRLFGVDDSPNWIASTPAVGTRYRFSAWVMSPTSRGLARLQVRELLNGTNVGGIVRSAAVSLSPTWQMLSVDFVTQAAGSTLDFQVTDSPLLAGEVFQTDDVSIQIVSLPAAVIATAAARSVASVAEPPLRPVLAPSPMTSSARLSFATSRSGPLRVEIFDVAGRQVRRLAEESEAPAGQHQFLVDGRDGSGARLSAGLYLYRIRAAEGVRLGRFVVVR